MTEFLINLDGSVLLWLQNNLRNEILTPFFQAVTWLGDKGKIWILVTIVLLISKKTRSIGIMSAFALIFASVFNNIILKGFFDRTRPYDVVEGLTSVIGSMKSSSFPSGHTSSSFAAATVLFHGLPRRYGILFMVLAALIAFSRMYLGVHYPSDVAVGALTGIASGLAVIFLYNKISGIPWKKKTE
ncbi:MAG: phosphatase PAP2 family protein [Lachnospiraceae bacterium]|nr:phosphatase PAP2 family protein [Lachnospiraceae bacterium]